MNSRSARASASASASASVSALGDSGHHQGLFVVPQSPPPSWSPPASAHFQSAHAMDGDMAHKGGGSAFQRLIRDLRVLDFALAAVVWVLSRVILMVVDVHERSISSIEIQLNATATFWARDPVINHKELPEQVTNMVLAICALAAPIVVNIVMNLLLPLCNLTRRIPHDTRDLVLTLVQAVSMEMVLTNFLKRLTGRLRPCFFDMCGWQSGVEWDGVSNLCTDAHGEKEARQSFPSGHSALAWASSVVLTLYLLGRARINLVNRGESLWIDALTTLKLVLSFAPTFLAAWVAVTRTTDNWHHYSDVLAGSLIGCVCAGIAYTYNYSSIFSATSAGLPRQELNSRLKRKHLDGDEEERKTLGAISITGHQRQSIGY